MIVTNQSNVKYDYVLPDQSTQSGEQSSNIVNTEILTSAVTKVKSSDHTFLSEGETAQQTVVVTNNSTVTLQNVFFKDVMSGGASYVAGSVVVNGVAQPSYDLVAGFTLPDIAPGGSVTVTYTIRADSPMTQTPVVNHANLTYTVTDPIKGPVTYAEDTNDVSIDVVSVGVTNVKSVDKALAVSGDTLHYTSVITNSGTQEKINLFFTDDIPAGTSFVAGSVKIGGTSYPTYNPATGFALPNLPAGASVTVEFDVKVN